MDKQAKTERHGGVDIEDGVSGDIFLFWVSVHVRAHARVRSARHPTLKLGDPAWGYLPEGIAMLVTCLARCQLISPSWVRVEEGGPPPPRRGLPASRGLAAGAPRAAGGHKPVHSS